MTLNEELSAFVDFIPTIPAEKRYWLIRTKSWEFYDAFRLNNIVAIEHNEVPLSELRKLKDTYKEDFGLIQAGIKTIVRSEHEKRATIDNIEEIEIRRSSLTASQIFKFVFEVKKGDMVLIPSSNSDIVSFGIVNESYVGDFSKEELRKIDTDAILMKRVTWISDLKRFELDPYLYRMFTAHQAINDVGSYADVIERSVGDFFILDDEAHVILNITNENEISAFDLFKMGTEILSLIDLIAKEFNIECSSKDISVTINLNSPGKIDLKSKIKKSTTLLGILVVLMGGGMQTKSGLTIKSDGIPGLVKSLNDFLDKQQQRDMNEKVFEKYKDKIQVKQPDDVLKLLKQYSDNKDQSK